MLFFLSAVVCMQALYAAEVIVIPQPVDTEEVLITLRSRTPFPTALCNLVIGYISSTYFLTKTFKHPSFASSVDFSPDGKYIAAGGYKGYCRIFDVITEKVERIPSPHTLEISAIRFSPDGKQFAAGSVDKTISMWEAKPTRLLYMLDNKVSETSKITKLSFSPHNQYIVAGDHDGSIHMWDLETQTKNSIGRHNNNDAIRSTSFNQDGKYLVTASFEELFMWNMPEEKMVDKCIVEDPDDAMYSASLNPDAQHILTAHDNKTAYIRDIAKNIILKQFIGHVGPVTWAGYHPDGSIITASLDKTVRLWDIRTEAQTHMLMGYESKIQSVSCSPDGTRIVTASNEPDIRLWELRYCPHPKSIFARS